MSEKAKPKSSDSITGIIEKVLELVQRFGLTNFLLVTAVIFFLLYSEDRQKVEAIDRYLLGKQWSEPQNILSNFYIYLVLLIALIVSIWYCRTNAKMRKAENNRLGEEKSFLQQLLTEQNLTTSK